MDVREELLSLLSIGYRARNGLSPETARFHAAALLDLYDRQQDEVGCRDPLAGTIWETDSRGEVDGTKLPADVAARLYGSAG